MVANDELTAFKTYDAVAEFIIEPDQYDALVDVPNNDPVNALADTIPSTVINDPDSVIIELPIWN